jgi:hypothetical protein
MDGERSLTPFLAGKARCPIRAGLRRKENKENDRLAKSFVV